jgi:hypothetical protein
MDLLAGMGFGDGGFQVPQVEFQQLVDFTPDRFVLGADLAA